MRRDDQFLSVEGGSLNLNAQPGEDIHGGATGQRNIVLQDLPDSGPWTATARVTWNPTVNFQNAGLVIYHGRRELDQERHGVGNGRAFEAFKELNNTRVRASARRPSTPRSRPRSTCASRATARRSGPSARRTARPGPTPATPTNLNGLTNPKVGMYATASTAAGTQANTARFDYFTLDAPQDPSDEFDGTSLNLCRWIAERPARSERLHGRRGQPDAAGGAWRLLRQRAERQPEHPPPAGPVRPVDDDHAAHVQPERELRAGRPAGLRRRRQLRQGRLRLRRRSRAGVPARGEQRRGRLRRLREHLDAADDGRHADHLRRHDAAFLLPVRGRSVDAVRRARDARERAEPEDRRLRQRRQPDGDDARERGVRLLPHPGGAAGHHGADHDPYAGAGRERRGLEHGQRHADAGYGGRRHDPVQAGQRGLPEPTRARSR